MITFEQCMSVAAACICIGVVVGGVVRLIRTLNSKKLTEEMNEWRKQSELPRLLLTMPDQQNKSFICNRTVAVEGNL